MSASSNKFDNTVSRYISISCLDSQTKKLIKASVDAMKYAYCPYSKFQVGASVQCNTGNVYTGCNVENASYGLSICAERTALVKAISSGDTDIRSIAVCADGLNGPSTPCGACRQFIMEFANTSDIMIYLTNSKMDTIKQTSINQLLPDHFVLTN